METPVLLFSSQMVFFWLIMLFFLSFSATKVRLPLNKRMPKDMLKLRNLLSGFKSQLIPWKRNEIELLSLNRQDVKTEQKRDFVSTGNFVSIYHEPIFSYGYKQYQARDKFGVLFAQTQKDELFFYEFPKEVEVQFNDFLGHGRLAYCKGKCESNII